MVYSDGYKYIFLAVPKTGSRAVQDYLQSYGTRSKRGWIPNHNNYEQVMKELGEERREYFKFAFFRNPWSFLISIFFWNRHKHGLPLHKKSVVEWLNAYRGGDSYAPYIFDKNGEVTLDFIGKLENIKEDFAIICKKINIPVPRDLPKTGLQSISGRLHYTEYYEDIRLREKIKEMFAKSNSVLNYQFERGV